MVLGLGPVAEVAIPPMRHKEDIEVEVVLVTAKVDEEDVAAVEVGEDEAVNVAEVDVAAEEATTRLRAELHRQLPLQPPLLLLRASHEPTSIDDVSTHIAWFSNKSSLSRYT